MSIPNNRVEPISADAPEKLLFTEAEAAKLLSVSPRTLWGLRKAGKIRFIRIGSSGIRYSGEHLHEFIQNNSTTEV